MGKIKVGKTYTRTKTYESPKMVDGKLSYTLYNDKGENVGQTLVDPGTDMSGVQDMYFTKGQDGLWQMSDVPKTNISMDSNTGKIKITAPKSVTSTEQFKQFIDEDQLKLYSQAYKLNKNYKIQVQEKNEETGEDETKEVTIPEYIERLNSSLTKYFENLRDQKKYTRDIIKLYGDKSKNLTEEQIVMSAQGSKGAKATYLPDTLLTVGSFGNNIENPFKKLQNKRGENDEISAEDLAEVWKRENFGREEVAALMALINGHLEGSDWSKDTYYEDADKNMVYNRNSAEEAAKLIAFKNYVLNNNPHAEWYQQAGDWIESASVNFGTAFTNVFANLAVMGEGAVDMLPGVEAKSVLDWKNQEDETLSNYNAVSAQAWDALTNAQIWGYLAGSLTGAVATSWLGGKAASGLQKEEAITYTHIKQISDNMASELGISGAAAQALTPQTMAQMFEGGEYATLGTRLWLNGLTAANRSLEVTNATLSAISGAIHTNVATEYLFDTLHDAIVFDGSTMRNVIEAVRADDKNENRQQVINYWIGQFAENAMFWAPLGISRVAIKTAGKTATGKAANAVLTRFINKVSASIGYKKMSIRDKLANGSVVDKLKKDIEKAINDDKFTKAMRLQRKLDIENWNSITRDARKRLGDLELKWEGGKLTKESLNEFNNFVNDVKILENGIDAYNRNIVNKIDEYTIKQVDPSTGMRVYLNPDLGESNAKVTMYYWDLVDLNKKYKLPIAKDSLLNQDVVDYWMNSYYKRLADKFADSDGVNALKAQNAAEILQSNIDALAEIVPEEIKMYIDRMLDRKIYQGWYYAQNEYGMSKGLLNRSRTIGYQNNPIWKEVGYMPIRVQQDLSGRWIPDDGRIDAVVEQDWDSLKFNVSEGQHYADPELVRQSRLRKLAQAEVSSELFKAYKGFTNSATNIVKITGEETEYVNTIKSNMQSLDTSIEEGARNVFKENFNVRPQIDKDKKFTKNIVVPEDTRTVITTSMSPSQTTDFLVQKKVLDGPNAKLTDNVTLENYDDWFKQQSTPVKKYLVQQYSQLEEGGIASGSSLIPGRYLSNELSESASKIDDLVKASAFQKRYDELERYLKTRMGRGRTGGSIYPSYLRNSTRAEQAVNNGQIPESEMVSNFAEQLIKDYEDTGIGIGDSVKAKEYLAYKSLSEGDYDNIAYPDSITKPGLKSKVQDYLNLKEGGIASGSSANPNVWVKEWTQEDWDAFYEIKAAIDGMDRIASMQGSYDSKILQDIRKNMYNMAQKVPYKGKRTVASIKTEVINELKEYDLPTSRVESIITPSRYSFDDAMEARRVFNVNDIKSGEADITTRVRLAQKVANESGGEKLVAWRTQGEGIDDFYGSSGGHQTSDLVSNEKWKGGRWINIGGKPFDVYGFGTKELVFPVKSDDILDEFTIALYKESADDLLAFKAVSPTEKQKVMKQSILQLNESVEDIPYYKELSKLDEDTLKKIANGDPRALLDVTDKKIIKYDGIGRDNREYVIFPDRNPEILRDGIKDMAKASKEEVDQGFRVIKNPYALKDIKSGKVSDDIRQRLATRVITDELGDNWTQGFIFQRWQKDIDDIHGDTADVTSKWFKEGEKPVTIKGDGAYELESYVPGYDKLKTGDTRSRIIFPVERGDVLRENEYRDIHNIAKSLYGKKADSKTLDAAKNYRATIINTKSGAKSYFTSDDILNKMIKMKDSELKRFLDNDLRAYAELSGKGMILPVVSTPEGLDRYPGVFAFPDLSPNVAKKGLERMAKITGELDTQYTASPSTIRARNKKRIEALINDPRNLEFLNRLGWDRGIETTGLKNRYGDYKGARWSGQERIRVNLNSIETLPELESVEFHEITHAIWARTSLETRKAIGQDLVNRLGLNIEIDNLRACSEDMNELVAHAMETRFQSRRGWDVLKNDSVTKEHLESLAKHAGIKPTEAFKDRVMTLIRSFITFVKTKLLGINDAKTFDEFYSGLIRGDFADDLRKNLSEFLSEGGMNKTLYPKKNLTPLDYEAGKTQRINVGGDDSQASDIPVEITPSAKTPDQPPTETPGDDIIQRVINGRKIKIKNTSSPATSIFVDTGKPNSFALLEKAIEEGGDDFEAGLQRAYLAGDESFSKTSIMNEAAKNLEDGKDAFYQGVIVAKVKGETKNVKGLNTDVFWDDMLTTIRGQLNDYVSRVKSSPGARAAIDALAKTTNGSEEVATYVALRQLKKSYMKDIKGIIHDHIDGLKQLNSVPKGDIDLLKRKTDLLINDIVNTELDDATNVARVINPDLVDSKNIYDEVKALAKEIEGAEAKKTEDYIMYLDDQGRQVYTQVDPAFASLFNTRAKITKAQASGMARFNALASRAFRYGTTSVNLSAFGNQMFRDFGNAILVGGAWQTIKSNADNLRDVFGDRIVEQIKAFDPDEYEMRQISKIAQESGQTIQQAAVSRELMRGSAIAGTTTETSLYRDFMKQAYGEKSDDLLNRAEGKIKELWKKYDPDKYMNGKRENYLRNRVYASSLNDAMKEGYTLKQARTYAEFAMNNATTNFSRQLYHLQAIADSTPYFRATINGTKSFWRMWSLDPVGISGRIMGGLILPVMFLTGASLGDDENREVYKNIPEYQKHDALIFVMNGEAVSIQLPQELSPIVSPFRQFVEYLYDANQNDFWELMSNDLLGFCPYNLTGFTAVDYDRMIDDPTFFDRTSRGFSRLFSQMAPVPLKTAYMIASGTDPYSGKWLRDPSYAYWNDETNSVETMDYYQSTFATYFARLFPGVNPAIADKVLSGIFGSTGSNLLGDIAVAVVEGPEAAAKSVGKNLFEQATKPVVVEDYNLVDSVWKRAVRQLTQEKNDLLQDKKMQELNKQLSQTKDPEKRQKLLAERQDMVDAYQQSVAKMVERLSSEYKGTFDRQKFAAVIALLNFNSDPAYQEGSQYSSNIASEMFWNGRDAAIHTMERLGITGTSDMSIFGYLTTDRDGNPVMKYSSPVAIMDMSNQWDNQDDINAANIKALLSQNNMYDAHKAISTQIDKIYNSKKKLSSQDYSTIDAIKINWNAQLAKVIAPYINSMTPEAALNNREVLNLLYPYVEVPNSWANRSVGKRGNKKQAYYESWLKSMFSVNDPYKGQY